MHVLLILLMTLLSGCGAIDKGEKIVQDVKKVAQDTNVVINDAQQVVKDVEEA